VANFSPKGFILTSVQFFMDLESRLTWLERSVRGADDVPTTLNELVALLIRDFHAGLNTQARLVLVSYLVVYFDCLYKLKRMSVRSESSCWKVRSCRW
jgi:hypothetical protein